MYFGELAVVQPLLVAELIFALALRKFRLHDFVPVKSWYAAGLVCLGLAAFLVLADFHGGMRVPHVVEWVVALSACSLVAAVLLAVGRSGSPARRAGCIGAAAAVVWAVDASFVKQLTDTLHLHGFLGAFDHWPLYALAVSGILGAVLTRRPSTPAPSRRLSPPC